VSKLNNKTYLILFGVVIGVALLGGILLMGGKPKTPEATPGASLEVLETSPAVETPGTVSGVKEIVIEGDEYAFSPKTITLFKGEKVRLTFKNTGNLPHNFMVQGLGIATRTISGGQTDTVEFTPEEAGTYPFYCSVGGHKDLGMEGSIVVE
jgi:plastocyanin